MPTLTYGEFVRHCDFQYFFLYWLLEGVLVINLESHGAGPQAAFSAALIHAIIQLQASFLFTTFTQSLFNCFLAQLIIVVIHRFAMTTALVMHRL